MESKDILSQIEEGRTVSKSLVESANQEILKNKEESLKREVITALVDSEYSISYRKLALRRARAIEEVEKETIEATGENRKRLEEGGITPEQWRKKEVEINDENIKKISEVRGKYNEYLRQLNKMSPDVSWGVEKEQF